MSRTQVLAALDPDYVKCLNCGKWFKKGGRSFQYGMGINPKGFKPQPCFLNHIMHFHRENCVPPFVCRRCVKEDVIKMKNLLAQYLKEKEGAAC